MKILITGAAGFMGSHLFDFFKGHDVWGMDNYSIGTYKNPKILSVELLDKDEVDEAIELIRPDIVFHLAAWAHEGLSQFCPTLITENNYNAYLNVLTSSIRHGVKKIVFTSSMSVYGDQQPPFDEEMKRKPCDIYAVAKTACEEATELLSKVYDFKYVIIRPHNVYGPRQVMHDPYRNVVGIFMNRALRGEPLYIYGDGEQKRAFSYIDDVTPFIAHAGLSDLTGEIINVGPLEEFSINQLAQEVRKHFPHIETTHLPDRPLEVKHAWCTNDKATNLLGYTTQTSFSDGIRKMAQWAKEFGPQEFKHLSRLELVTKETPHTWTNKL